MKRITLLIKPVSGSCNLRCSYCFYTEEMEKRTIPNYGVMTEEILTCILKRVFEESYDHCTIAFQGGEPTLAGLSFYEAFVNLVEKWNTNGCELQFAIQTNGYTLNETWAKFFKKHNFLVGISLDGIEESHDVYRIDYSKNGTFHKVSKAIECLKYHKVEYNVLTVIHKETIKYVNRIYNLYKRCGISYQQYIELVCPLDMGEESVRYGISPKEYGEFLIALFKKWYKDIVKGDYVSIQYFEDIMDIFCGMPPVSCTSMGMCGNSLVIEADGGVYPCDFYVLDEWKLGNIKTDSIEEIQKKQLRKLFIEQSKSVPKECQKCQWYPLCRNGCRRNCEGTTGKARGKNYYCEGYKMFFEYAYPYMVELRR